jgi:hypothetical protein
MSLEGNRDSTRIIACTRGDSHGIVMRSKQNKWPLFWRKHPEPKTTHLLAGLADESEKTTL